MRLPLMAGNWKMYKTPEEAKEYVAKFKPLVANVEGVETALCPPFPALAAVAKALEGSKILLGAQNMHFAPAGAFTGEVSPLMLKAVGCRLVIIGHSERRTLFGETNELVRRKVKAAFQFGLFPILCVGETLEEREAGKTKIICREQLESALQDLGPEEVGGLVLAYEPVWAIGTGKTARPGDAQEVISFLRELIASRFGAEAAQRVRIQYGGSVKPENIRELMLEPDIDGVLVGGASLDPQAFAQIVNFRE